MRNENVRHHQKVLKNPYPQVGFVLGLSFVAYLAFADLAVDHVIAQHPGGESVVSMAPGWLRLVYLFTGTEPPLSDGSRYRYQIDTIEYRAATGKTLARYAPRFTPNDHAEAAWTDKFVLISSGMNGECPDFRAFDRKTGEAAEENSSDLEALPPEIQRNFDPCGLGREEYEAWQKEQGSQGK